METIMQKQVYEKATEALVQKLGLWGYEPLPPTLSAPCMYFVHRVHKKMLAVLIYTLNLNEASSVTICQHHTEYKPHAHLWIMLAMYMNSMKPVFYLIPSMVFKYGGYAFVNRKQAASYTLKVSAKAIDALNNNFMLDDVKKL